MSALTLLMSLPLGVRSGPSIALGSAPNLEPQMEGPPTLDDVWILQHQVAPAQVAEVCLSLAEQHRDEADRDLVHQAEVERLLDHRRARDADIGIPSQLLRLGDCLLNA